MLVAPHEYRSGFRPAASGPPASDPSRDDPRDTLPCTAANATTRSSGSSRSWPTTSSVSTLRRRRMAWMSPPRRWGRRCRRWSGESLRYRSGRWMSFSERRRSVALRVPCRTTASRPERQEGNRSSAITKPSSRSGNASSGGNATSLVADSNRRASLEAADEESRSSKSTFPLKRPDPQPLARAPMHAAIHPVSSIDASPRHAAVHTRAYAASRASSESLNF